MAELASDNGAVLILFPFLALAITIPDYVTLRVGIHHQAGTIYDIAADGASGHCSVAPAVISCPATGPVTFRWGAGGPWEFSGDKVVDPGETGVAFVMAREDDRFEERARLHRKWVNARIVRQLFVRTGDNAPPVPSRGMVEDLLALVDHPDPAVRREVVEGMYPFIRDTASDPFSRVAPELIGEGYLLKLSLDEDAAVQRRLGQLLREVPPGPLAAEAGKAIRNLTLDDTRSVRRVGMSLLIQAARNDLMPPEQTWTEAISRVKDPYGPGQFAAGTLARLGMVLEPSETVDPVEAVSLTVTHHREKAWRVWRVWRQHVPFNAAWAEMLFRDSMGISRGLLLHWSQENPDALAEVILRWEPVGPHSRRFELAQTYLTNVDHQGLRDALDLPALGD
ncbi:MAG: hypothetical protein HN348_00100 [Proteobacteria bacterium]|nr:hypothetical protein [Pseudomonadota bacterium]